MLRLLCCALFLQVLSLSVTDVLSCTCEPQTWIQQFCTDPFAGLFYVKDNTTLEGDSIVFEVKQIAMYRTIDVPKKPKVGKIYTPVMSSLCGIPLMKNQRYVITGYYMDSGNCVRMTTGLCYLQLSVEQSFTPPDCATSY